MAHGTCWPCGLGPILDSCQPREVVISIDSIMVQKTELWERSQGW